MNREGFLDAKERRAIWIELGIVLALSLGASAAYSIVSFIAKLTAPKGLGGSQTTINASASPVAWLDLTYQLFDVIFGLAPVALVLFLVWRSWGEQGLARMGIGRPNWLKATGRGLGLAALIGIPGLGLYIAARLLGLSAKVIPTAVTEHWWVPLVLLLLAAKAALLEETIVVGYLFARLDELGVSRRWVLLGSALLRGAYHLYQGVGGFVGNLAMGLIFGWFYRRWSSRGSGALWPLMIAHFILDAVIFVGYSLVDLSHVLP